MATTALTVQNVVRTGLNPTYSSAASGDGNVFNNAGHNVFIHVKNGGGGGIVVSIDTPNTIDGLAIPAKTVSIAAAAERMIGPFPPMYDQEDTDNSIDIAVKVTYDIVTSVTVAAIALPSGLSV